MRPGDVGGSLKAPLTYEASIYDPLGAEAFGDPAARVGPALRAGRHILPTRLAGTASPTSKGAFSLIEVMCATLILAVGVVGLTTAITTALGSSKESELQSTAAMIAAGQIETLRASGLIVDGDDEGEFGGGLSLYRWKQTIAPTNIDGLHEVTVTVANTKSGREIYELKTMLFDPPLDKQEEKDKTRDKKKETNKRQGRNR